MGISNFKKNKFGRIKKNGFSWPLNGEWLLLFNYLFHDDSKIPLGSKQNEMMRLMLLGFKYEQGLLNPNSINYLETNLIKDTTQIQPDELNFTNQIVKETPPQEASLKQKVLVSETNPSTTAQQSTTEKPNTTNANNYSTFLSKISNDIG